MKLSAKLKRRALWIILSLLALHVLQIALYAVVNPPLTVTQMQAVLEGHDFKRNHVPLGEIAPDMLVAVIAAEDQKFAIHYGFDVNAIKGAFAHNTKGGSLRGGSSISQQVAKNAFLWQQRSWLRKGLEAYYTAVVELFYGKSRILELYANVAQTGEGMFGFDAAARHYFQKSAAQLSRREAALIAACLPSPETRNPARPSVHVLRKARWIEGQFGYLKAQKEIQQLLKDARR